ncbi:MAG: HAD hydrolase family protein [Candidatus Aminicenantes bacterium]|nr:MAG: HAD hydrolase family protein [Candidatus Aminicenantes bacterium]
MDQKELAKKVKLIIMDVDGTLSDGRFFVLPDGTVLKSFDVKDGTGVIFSGLAGIKTAIITGKKSEAVRKRAEELHIDDYYEGVRDKTTPFLELLEKYGLQKEEVAYIGDDIGDAEVMGMVGFSAAVGDAHPLIKRISHYIAKRYGGRGAVREVVDFILDAQEKWPEIFLKIKNSKNSEEIMQKINA